MGVLNGIFMWRARTHTRFLHLKELQSEASLADELTTELAVKFSHPKNLTPT